MKFNWKLKNSEHLIFSEKRIGIVFWAYIFAVSKYFELFDTLLLIIRKKPVSFLHWFHHATVLLYTWYAEYTHFTIGLLFIIVNSFVHTFMYYYYFLAEIGLFISCPHDFWSLIIAWPCRKKTIGKNSLCNHSHPNFPNGCRNCYSIIKLLSVGLVQLHRPDRKSVV